MARQKGKTRTATEMRKLVSAQIESGKSIKSFCQEREIGVWIFGYWRKRLRDLDNKSTAQQRFAEVKISKDRTRKSSSAADLKVTVHQNFEVSIPADFDAEHLKSVLWVLKSC